MAKKNTSPKPQKSKKSRVRNDLQGVPFLPLNHIPDYRFVYFKSLIESSDLESDSTAQSHFKQMKRKTGYQAVEYLSQTPSTDLLSDGGKRMLGLKTEDGSAGKVDKSFDTGLNQVFLKYQSIINWLDRIANQERQKELLFMKTLQSKLSSQHPLIAYLNDNTLSNPSNFADFIIAFNSVTTELSEFRDRISEEQKRLHKNRAEYEAASKFLLSKGLDSDALRGAGVLTGAKNKPKLDYAKMRGRRYGRDIETALTVRYGGNYGRTYLYDQAEIMVSLAKTLFSSTSTGSKNSYANVFKDYLLQRYSAQIANHITADDNGNLKVDPKLQSLLYGVAVKAFTNFFRQNQISLSDVFQQTSSVSYKERMKSLQSFINQQSEGQDVFGLDELDKLMEDPRWRQNVSESVTAQIMTQERQIKKGDKRRTSTRSTKRKNISNVFSQKNIEDMSSTISKNNPSFTVDQGKLINAISEALSESSFEVRAELMQHEKGWIQSELQTLLNSIIPSNGNITSIGLGSGGSTQKTDVGQLIITSSFDEASATKKVAKILEANMKKNKTMQELTTAASKGDNETSARQLIAIDEMLKTYDKVLQDIVEKDNAMKVFYIQHSNKLYESLSRTTTEGFSGGKFGGNILAYLDKVQYLYNNGLLTDADTNWLGTAIINCNSHTVIGTSQKEPLMAYLSALTAQLLFDDFNLLGNFDIGIEGQEVPMSTPTVLHVFDLQGTITVPISYVLYQLRDDLTKKYETLAASKSATGQQQIVRATISTSAEDYPKDKESYEDLSKEDWEKVASAAAKAMHIELAFFGGFLDFLNKLTSSTTFSMI